MAKIIDMNNEAIVIQRTTEFYEAAVALGEHIKTLPINTPQNDKLIELMLKQLETAEQGAFEQGFRTGTDFAKAYPDLKKKK